SGATSYNVYRGTTSGGESATAIASGTTTTSYTDTTVTNGTAYYYEVASINASGTSARSNEATATPGTAPSPPTNVTVTIGNAQNVISWTASAGATSYNVLRGTASNGEATTPIVTGLTATSYTDSGLVNGTTYYYEVEALNAYGTSAPSSQASGTPEPGIPPAPAGLTATGGTTQVALAWTASSGATSYNVYRGTAAGGESATAIATALTTVTYTNTGLLAGETYYYKVAAVNTSGTSPQSTEASAITIAGVPAGVTATAGNLQVALTWTASTGAASYDVYRGTASGGESATPIATAVTTASYTNTGLTAGTAYYYKVTSVDAAGTSAQSSEVSATPTSGAPAVPTGLAATAGNAQVALSWTASSGATSYNVFRSTASGGEGTTAYKSGITTTSYTDTGLINGATYYYTANAVNSYGSSAQTAQVSATPSAGSGSMVIGINAGGTATGSWVADTDFAGGTETTVTATVTTTAVTNPAPEAVYQSNRYGAMTYTVGGLTANGSYTVRLHFAETYFDAAGDRTFNVSINSTQVLTDFDMYKTAGGENIANIQPFSATANASGQIVIAFANVVNNAQINGIEIDSSTPVVPNAPTGLTAVAGNTQVSLSWTASSGATSYNVYRGTAAGGESATAIATGVTTATYTNTGLTNGTAYYYKVAAVNSVGTSGMSNEASATPTASAAPVVEINCGGAAVSGTSWVADTDFSGGTETSVTTTVTTTAVTNPAPEAVYQSNRYGAMTYTVGGLTANGSYVVRLHFAETYWTATGKREFNVAINSTSVLTDFDIFATAGGENIANIQQFNATANSSGQIVIAFTNVVDNAQINGIEIDN
ncbi:MAG: malectin domain-containing carbohydrate-binding protein, partial [Capsulimonadaceae bacterium]